MNRARLRHGLVALMLMAMWVLATGRRWLVPPVSWPSVEGFCWVKDTPEEGPFLRCPQPARENEVPGSWSGAGGQGPGGGGLRRLTEGERFALGWPLDLNRACLSELTLLPGIGPVRAKAIGAYRDRRGRIDGLDDLIEIKGIGPKTVRRLRFITRCGRPSGQLGGGASP
jgi:competence ComEA-like helix-hairpin-helix protein